MNDEYQVFEWILAINSPWQIDRLTFSCSWRKWSDFINITNCCWGGKKKSCTEGRREKRVESWLQIAHLNVSAAICGMESLPIDVPPFSHLGYKVTSLAGKEWLELWKDFTHNHATLFFKCKLHLHQSTYTLQEIRPVWDIRNKLIRTSSSENNFWITTKQIYKWYLSK